DTFAQLGQLRHHRVQPLSGGFTNKQVGYHAFKLVEQVYTTLPGLAPALAEVTNRLHGQDCIELRRRRHVPHRIGTSRTVHARRHEYRPRPGLSGWTAGSYAAASVRGINAQGTDSTA